MKRSAMSLALFYAACGFAAAGAVLLAPAIQADNVGDQSIKTSLSTPTFDLAARFNAEKRGPELVATNTTDKSQKVEWVLHVQSSEAGKPGSRLGPMPTEQEPVSSSLTLAPHESRAVPVDVHAGKERRVWSATVTVGEESLTIPLLDITNINPQPPVTQ